LRRRLKIVSIVGARPQFVKAWPVSCVLRQRHTEILVHTGHHYDHKMSEIFFSELGIPRPDHNLEVGSDTHGRQTGLMLARIEDVLLEEQPDWVLVYGDTNSTLAGALAAAKLHIPVGHIESGLRSFNRSMPEEVNRVLTDHVSDLLFCPTQAAVANLVREGIDRGVSLVGDVMYDAMLRISSLVDRASHILSELNLRPRGYLLATVHRPANTDDPVRLRRMVDAFAVLDEPVIFPAHPRVRKALATSDISAGPLVRIIEPVGYLDMLALEREARLILTDSGGLQKEAYLCGVPCVTLREETEWVETVEAGWNILVGSDPERIAAAVATFHPKGERPPIFGDGHASERIAELLD